MTKSEFYTFLRKIPKAEIHLHAEGVISKATVKSFLEAKKENVDVDTLFTYKSLREFITAFLYIQSLFEDPKDIKTLFVDVAEYLRENNIVYCELFFSPSLFVKKGFDFKAMIDVISSMVQDIEKKNKVKIKLIVDLSRTFGVENAQSNLEMTLKHKSQYICGVGLGGDELKGPAKDFKDVFLAAKEKGLHVVAHAGEDDGPRSIWDALQVLKVERIGHGIAAIQDKKLLDELKAKQIPLEICLTSNIFTQKFVSKVEDHPIRQFFDHGLLVTVNTDDPTFFNASIIDEFWKLHSKLKFTMDEIKQLVINGFRASFLNTEDKTAYIGKVNEVWAQEMLALKKKRPVSS